MSFMGNKAKTAAVVLMALFLCQCGKEGKEKDFSVNLDSTNPLVRFTDTTFSGTEITANWFNLEMTVTNNTDQSVRIDEIIFYITVDGEEQSPVSFDLGMLSVTDVSGVTYDYINYCLYPADGLTVDLGACQAVADDINDTTPTGSVSDVIKPITLYIGSIPTQESGSRVYRVRAELLGVFISNGVETDRFQKRVYFTTR